MATLAAPPARPPSSANRWLALDVMRGLVMLLLLPDLSSGFGLERMAKAYPGDPFWAALAAPLRHVDWEGMALWDLVMPCFSFVIGASMVFSFRSQAERGDPGWLWRARSLRRAIVLVLLGVLVSFKPRTAADEWLPLLLVAASWPAGDPQRFAKRPLASGQRLALEWLIWGSAIGLAVWSIASRWGQLSRADVEALTRVVLVLLGGGYAIASLFVSRRGQVVALAALFVLWGLAFIAWPMLGLDPAAAQPGAAWRNGTNLAAAGDRWLFSVLLGPGPYHPEPHGYHALQVVPLAMLMLAGAWAAQQWVGTGAGTRPTLRLLRAGGAGLALGGLLWLAGIPLVKSIWTPSFLACSAAIMLLLLALLGEATARTRPAPWFPLVVLGSNAILLYVLTYWERWRIAGLWTRLGGDALAGQAAPLAQALWVLAFLWLLGAVLYRLRIFLRV